ncbi:MULTISPECIES: type II toxin-antitoxin system VapC family toxin [unclassified Archaeoglobus]|jgi:predicted nucleic acid-binding protein|uniref:type II toxin-antitoxin system VapC family toxin n=1 Tax=unclassified Archaeoglobus TaxID=2643606 RepID=UPI0025B937C9|nr:MULTISPECIES: type II toxin-antitoxin system VapC family toxin [unclassified Archaeoglobus]
MFCLETTFLVDLLKGKKRAIETYKKIRDSKLFTTSISAWELIRGPKLVGRKKEFEDALEMLENIDILPFSFNSAKIAVEVERHLREKGMEINLVDVLIASVAIEHGLKLVTRDEHFSRIKGLEVVNY